MEIGYEKCEVASLDMEDFVEGKSYRLVVQRSPLKDKDGSRLRNLSPDPFFRLQRLAEGLMPMPAHRHRETCYHLIGSYGYIYMGG